MYISLLIKGIILGFSIAAPLGPIGVLCVKRTLAQGRVAGLCSGLGTATADAFYGFIAAFGLTFISNFFLSQKYWFSLLGGIFLCCLGLKTLLAKPFSSEVRDTGKGLWGLYFSTFFLTLTNPITILSFMAVFAGLGLGSLGGYFAPGILVLGIFLGSAMWWFILSSGVELLRGRFDAKKLRWVNFISGIIIISFGVGAFLGI